MCNVEFLLVNLCYIKVVLLLVSAYLCRPDANIYGIDFTRFKLRDVDSNTVLFEVAKPEGSGMN